jgi:serine/threonine-protein kinase
VLERPSVPGERYQILELVGQGGMGAVYRARDLELGREVALKVLRPETSSEALAGRLWREARILASLEHPGIIPVHDVGTLADGRVFYVMKLVRGTRLDHYAEAAANGEVLRVFLRVCDAIGFAHAQGILHRDLKPANIMVGPFGEVLVLDWGIARTAPEPESPASAVPDGTSDGDTAPGTVMGTPGFMAPEQAQGDLGRLDARSDVYALGAILRTVARPGAAGSRVLGSICAKACAVDPSDRYPSAAELAAEVTRYLDGQPVLAHRETAFERAARIYSRYQTPIILILTYLTMRLLFLAARGL